MNDPDRLDEAALRTMDDLQLEVVRHTLVRSGDDRAEQVAEHLLVRGIAVIERVARELCDLRGATDPQLCNAVVDASVRLQLRLLRVEKLESIERVASQLATDCVDALRPAPGGRPRLAPQPPQLRTIGAQLSDALWTGRVERKGGSNS